MCGFCDDLPEPPHWTELEETESELKRQDERWGQQDHPDVSLNHHGEPFLTPVSILLDQVREMDKEARETGTLGWDLILLEEALESLDEPDDEKRIEELIQVAAVALQWVKAIRRRQS